MHASAPSRPYLEGKKLNKIEQNKATKDRAIPPPNHPQRHALSPT
jgi:hypothetical protein